MESVKEKEKSICDYMLEMDGCYQPEEIFTSVFNPSAILNFTLMAVVLITAGKK